MSFVGVSNQSNISIVVVISQACSVTPSYVCAALETCFLLVDERETHVTKTLLCTNRRTNYGWYETCSSYYMYALQPTQSGPRSLDPCGLDYSAPSCFVTSGTSLYGWISIYLLRISSFFADRAGNVRSHLVSLSATKHRYTGTSAHGKQRSNDYYCTIVSAGGFTAHKCDLGYGMAHTTDAAAADMI
jgi:hypothetical protein